MNTALLLHGWEWNSEMSWFPWLKSQLEAKFLDVYVPNLPNTKAPILSEQGEYISVYASDFSDGGYIVWHSLWCQLALKFIEENSISNSVIILVAPSYPDVTDNFDSSILEQVSESLNDYFHTKADFGKLNKLNNKFVVLLSDDDPYIDLKSAEGYYSNLKNVEFLKFKNKWHFNTVSWITEIREILDFFDNWSLI